MVGNAFNLPDWLNQFIDKVLLIIKSFNSSVINKLMSIQLAWPTSDLDNGSWCTPNQLQNIYIHTPKKIRDQPSVDAWRSLLLSYVQKSEETDCSHPIGVLSIQHVLHYGYKELAFNKDYEFKKTQLPLPCGFEWQRKNPISRHTVKRGVWPQTSWKNRENPEHLSNQSLPVLVAVESLT